MVDLVFSGDRYARSHSNKSLELSIMLSDRHGAYNAYILPSGLSAISTILNVIIPKVDCIVYTSELYCDTPDIIFYLCNLYGKNYIELNIHYQNNQTLENTGYNFAGKRVCIFAESFSNPRGIPFRYSILEYFNARCSEIITIIDNTWMTEILQNPFNHGADFVVVSLTKYYSCGNAIGGAIIARNNLLSQEIMKHIALNGLHTSPHNIDIIISNYRTMEERLTRLSEKTIEIINYIFTRWRELKIYHPILDDTHILQLYPSVFACETTKLSRFYKAYKKTALHRRTSYGGVDTRIDPFYIKRDGKILFRISIGEEDISVIIGKLETLLDILYP